VPPHNLYTDGAHMTDLQHRVSPPAVSYAGYGTVLPSRAGKPLNFFTVTVSQSDRPTWRWNAALEGWVRTDPDTGAFVDAMSGRPVVATTVVVQQVHIATDPNVVDVNGVLGVSHTLTGTGPAQVFVDDMAYDATWSQPASGPPQLTLADGSPAPVSAGLVWVELVATGSPARLG